jgi:ABC-type transporter Mla subunit MlaD
MSERWDRPVGYVLIANAAVGFLLGLAGLIGLWWAEPRLTQGAQELTSLATRAVDATAQLLVGVDDAVTTATDNMGAIETTMGDVSATLKNTADLTSSVSDIAGTDVLNIVRQTRTSLDSVEKTAQLVDDVLGVVSRIPLVGARYQPEVPLHVSIQRVGQSLDPLPASITQVQHDLKAASTNLAAIERDVTTLTTRLGAIEENLKTVQKATHEYRAIAADLRTGLDTVQTGLPRVLRGFVWFGTAIMIWLMVAQLGLLTQGLERLRPRR